MIKSRGLIVRALLWLAVAVTSASADTVDLPASMDNTLYESAAGLFSNGSGSFIFAGRASPTNPDPIRRALIAFDVAAAVPAGSTIDGVTLTLHMSQTSSGGAPLTLHRVLADWGEGPSDAPGNEGGGAAAAAGDATWLHTFFDTQFWASPGGDFEPVPSATQTVSGIGFYSWIAPGMIADVQAWLDGAAPDYGWIVIGFEDVAQTAKRFDSRENGTAVNRPVLTVDFTPAGVTGACCLPGGTCIVVAGATACTMQGGVYEGDGTTCTPNPCPQPTGACCLAAGVCQELTSIDCASQAGTYSGDGTTCTPSPCPIFLEPFVDPLALPAVAAPSSGVAGGTATYDIGMAELQKKVHRDLPETTVWGYGTPDGKGGYDATYPGPTIEAAVDQTVTVNWINALPAIHHLAPIDTCMHGASDDVTKAVVHLHGAHTTASSDGNPDVQYTTGNQLTYEYPNHQLAAPLWYHDHALGTTRLNVYMGLAGFYFIRDAAEMALGLPSGLFELPLVVQDRTFDAAGQLVYPNTWQPHFYGDKVLVNGTVWPFHMVRQGKYRMRILNGSNTRMYTLNLSGGLTFTLIGNDGGLLDHPIAGLTEITLAPAERSDVIVDFEPLTGGTEILMTNSAPVPAGEPVVIDVMKFVVSAGPGYTSPVPPDLRTNEVLMEGDASMTRDFELALDNQNFPPCAGPWWLINGLVWDDIVEFPELGTTEIWRFNNPSGMTHPMHMHLVMFQVLDRTPLAVAAGGFQPAGGPMPPEATEQGWKDTVRVGPQESVRVIARFEDYEGRFPYHCHILEHEDHEMMRQFQTLIPCPADTDRSTVVDVADLLDVLALWGDCPLPCSDLREINTPDTCTGDTNRDCTVDVADLLAVLAAWGPC